MSCSKLSVNIYNYKCDYIFQTKYRSTHFNATSENKNLLLALLKQALTPWSAPREVCSCCHRCHQAEVWWQENFMKFHLLPEFMSVFMHHTNLWPVTWSPQEEAVWLTTALLSAKEWSRGALGWPPGEGQRGADTGPTRRGSVGH